MKPKNVFTAPSVVSSAIFSILLYFQPMAIKWAKDLPLTKLDFVNLAFSFVVPGGVSVFRYKEDEDTYTPKFFPGRDLTDLNGDGIPDIYQNQPHQPSNVLNPDTQNQDMTKEQEYFI